MSEFTRIGFDSKGALTALFLALGAYPCRIDGQTEIVPWSCENCQFLADMRAINWPELRRVANDIGGVETACPYILGDLGCRENFRPAYTNSNPDPHGKGIYSLHLADLLGR